MNECEHISVGSCKILSKEKSGSFNSGSLVVMGGIGCGENLIVKKTILCNDIGLNDNLISFEDKNYIKFKNNIIPENNNISLGNNKNCFNSITSRNFIFKNSLVGNNINVNNLNVDSNCLLGSNSKLLKKGVEECILKIDSRKNNVIFKADNVIFNDSNKDKNVMEINENIININNNFNIVSDDDILMACNPKEKKILINGEMFLTNVIRCFKKINIKSNQILDLDVEINLLKLDTNSDINLNLKNTNFTMGCTKKIIIYSNHKNVNVNIDNLYNLKDIGTGIEILFDGKKWILIGKF